MPIWSRSSVPPDAVELIKGDAMFAATPVLGPDGDPVIGWGSRVLPNGAPVPAPDSPEAADVEVSQRQADAMLERDLAEQLKILGAAAWLPIQECHAAALLAFLFAEGVGAFVNSPVMYALNKGHVDLAGRQLHRWCMVPGEAEGEMVLSLTKARRRSIEAEVFRGIDPEIAATRAGAKTLEDFAALKDAADLEAAAFAQAEVERQGGTNG
jgi:GH24 family phage-related lysozyme (muramidase)